MAVPSSRIAVGAAREMGTETASAGMQPNTAATQTEDKMRIRPIQLTAAEVRAVLDSSMAEFRRTVDPQPPEHISPVCDWYHPTVIVDGEQSPGPRAYGFWDDDTGWPCPIGGPGDRLWMQSVWYVHYRADCNSSHWHSEKLWVTTHGKVSVVDVPDGQHQPASTMPKWLSNEQWPMLLITGVRVVRAHDGEWLWVVEFEKIDD